MKRKRSRNRQAAGRGLPPLEVVERIVELAYKRELARLARQEARRKRRLAPHGSRPGAARKRVALSPASDTFGRLP